jgi:hypothetical protein
VLADIAPGTNQVRVDLDYHDFDCSPNPVPLARVLSLIDEPF